MELDAKIYVAGHRGMVGSAIVRALKSKGYKNLVLKISGELDLLNQNQVHRFFSENVIDYVFMAAAKVGGIKANHENPAQFIYNNTVMQANVLHEAYVSGVKKYLFLGSSCIYPKFAEQPICESELLTGPLEPTNEAYAIAKINGLKMAQFYKQQYGFNAISAMPTNLYGPNDNFNLESAHVLPALIHKFHLAKINHDPYVKIWGSGKPLREFMHVDDLAKALILIMEKYNNNKHINVGVGEDISIYDLALLIKNTVGFKGEIKLDSNQPDGTPRKLLNVDKLNQLGFTPSISLKEGIQSTYKWFLENEVRS